MAGASSLSQGATKLGHDIKLFVTLCASGWYPVVGRFLRVEGRHEDVDQTW